MFFLLTCFKFHNVKQNFYGFMASPERSKPSNSSNSLTAAQVAKRFVSLASRISYDDLKGSHERFWDSHENYTPED